MPAWLIRDDPLERGVRAYGADDVGPIPASTGPVAAVGRVSVVEAARVPQFWLLKATFFVCGYTSGGMVLTHFMPHALEHSFTELQASTRSGSWAR